MQAMSDTPKKRIVILGGGFAGIATAKELEKQLARDPIADIMLITRENFFLFTPMLHFGITSSRNWRKARDVGRVPLRLGKSRSFWHQGASGVR